MEAFLFMLRSLFLFNNLSYNLLKIHFSFLFLPIYLFAQIEESNNAFEFAPPLLDGDEIKIDGFIDENAWNNSLSLSNFTSYLPVDGRQIFVYGIVKNLYL